MSTRYRNPLVKHTDLFRSDGTVKKEKQLDEGVRTRQVRAQSRVEGGISQSRQEKGCSVGQR